MKKVALSLLAFALVGGMVSGQAALKIGGSLQTGFQADATAGRSQSFMYESDAGANLNRLRIDGTYDAGNTGVNFRLESTVGAAPTVKNAYAWAKFLDKTLAVKVGQVDDGSVKTQADLGKDFDQNLWVGYTGVPGLAVAVSLGLPTAGAPTVTTPLLVAVQGKYTIDKVASVAIGALTDNFAPRTVNVGAELLAVSGLTLAADAQIGVANSSTNMDGTLNPIGASTYAKVGATAVSEKAAYALDPITVNFLAYQYLFGADLKDSKNNAPLGYFVRPSVAYKVDAVTSVEGFFKYAVGPQEAKAATAAAMDSSAAFVVPQVVATFTLDSKAKVLVGYQLFYSLDKDKLNYGLTSAATPEKDPIKHTLNVDFRYSF